VLGYGVQDSYYFMVLDYIDGASLRDRMVSVDAQGLTLKTNLVVDILQQVGSALSYVHGLGFIHRDVKPGNIMLGNNGRVYLTDFGIVKRTGSYQMTATGLYLARRSTWCRNRHPAARSGRRPDRVCLGPSWQ
jgi:serine/threonine-protein kinase